MTTKVTIAAMTLREARQALGVSQERLAALTGGAISSQTIQQIELGRAVPRLATRILLAQALKRRVDEIDWPEQRRDTSSSDPS